MPKPKLMPMLSVRNGQAAVAFYQEAFEAVVDYQVGGTPDNEEVVAQLDIEGAGFWVSDESPENGSLSPEGVGGRTTRMLLIVDNPEQVIKRAVRAGATVTSAVSESHHWLLGQIEDPFGHRWEIGHPLVPWPPA